MALIGMGRPFPTACTLENLNRTDETLENLNPTSEKKSQREQEGEKKSMRYLGGFFLGISIAQSIGTILLKVSSSLEQARTFQGDFLITTAFLGAVTVIGMLLFMGRR